MDSGTLPELCCVSELENLLLVYYWSMPARRAASCIISSLRFC